MSLWLGWFVVVGMQRGVGSDVGSATMLKKSRISSEGCSGWVDSEIVGESLSSPCMLSLVSTVRSMIATIVVVVVLLLPLRLLFLEH